MENLSEIRQRNRDLAQRINEEVKADPQSAYAGKFVGIANGKVVSVGDNFEDGIRLLRCAEPDNKRTFFLEVGADYSNVEYIWENALMPRASWPLFHGRPMIEVVLTQLLDGRETVRKLLADSGAGSETAAFDMLLDEDDCINCGNIMGETRLGGAYSGSFPVYVVRIRIPLIGLDKDFRAVGVSSTPAGLDGIAGFRFLNRFNYGNFGDKGQFGLESE